VAEGGPGPPRSPAWCATSPGRARRTTRRSTRRAGGTGRSGSSGGRRPSAAPPPCRGAAGRRSWTAAVPARAGGGGDGALARTVAEFCAARGCPTGWRRAVSSTWPMQPRSRPRWPPTALGRGQRRRLRPGRRREAEPDAAAATTSRARGR
jgi:hypothetical protein